MSQPNPKVTLHEAVSEYCSEQARSGEEFHHNRNMPIDKLLEARLHEMIDHPSKRDQFYWPDFQDFITESN